MAEREKETYSRPLSFLSEWSGELKEIDLEFRLRVGYFQEAVERRHINLAGDHAFGRRTDPGRAVLPRQPSVGNPRNSDEVVIRLRLSKQLNWSFRHCSAADSAGFWQPDGKG